MLLEIIIILIPPARMKALMWGIIVGAGYDG
jgi:hypothetical protein